MTKKAVIITVVSSVVVIGGIIASYFLFFKKKDEDADSGSSKTNSGSNTKTPTSTGGSSTTGGSEYEEEVDIGEGEGSSIGYISPRTTGGIESKDSIDFNKIEVRTTDSVFSKGDVVTVKHPNYNFTATVDEVWDSPTDDGGTAIFYNRPFNKGKGTLHNGWYWDDQTKSGTITLKDPAPDTYEIEGDKNEEFYNLIGGKGKGGKRRKLSEKYSRKALLKAGIPEKFHNRPFLTKAEARARREKQVSGRKSGMRKKALRKFIRK